MTPQNREEREEEDNQTEGAGECYRFWTRLQNSIKSIEGKLEQLTDLVGEALEETRGRYHNAWDPDDLDGNGDSDY